MRPSIKRLEARFASSVANRNASDRFYFPDAILAKEIAFGAANGVIISSSS